jgi:tetratricopeptide (TPR) repeat protein
VQRFSYDNSADNIRNPFDPPRRVRYGQEATDEMGSLWIQLLPANHDDYQALYRAMGLAAMEAMVARYSKILEDNPQDVKAHLELGKVALSTGKLDDARRWFDQARTIDPQSALALYHSGHIRLRAGEWAEGGRLLREAVAVDPLLLNAHHDLGLAAMHDRHWATALRHFEAALKINPYHTTTLRNLATTCIQLGRFGQARDLLRRAVDADPADQDLAKLLRQVESQLGG